MANRETYTLPGVARISDKPQLSFEEERLANLERLGLNVKLRDARDAKHARQLAAEDDRRPNAAPGDDVMIITPFGMKRGTIRTINLPSQTSVVTFEDGHTAQVELSDIRVPIARARYVHALSVVERQTELDAERVQKLESLGLDSSLADVTDSRQLARLRGGTVKPGRAR